MEQMMHATGKDLLLLQDALLGHSMDVLPRLWSSLETMEPSDKRLLAVASTLLRFDPRSPNWSAYLPKVSQALTLTGPQEIDFWLNTLSPLRHELVEPLVAVFKNKKSSKDQRALASRALQYCKGKK